MLQATDLTIRLNPADDVVIARVELLAGTTLVKEGDGDAPVIVTARVPAGHKVAISEVKAGQPGAALQPDHRLRDARHPCRRARARAEPGDG